MQPRASLESLQNLEALHHQSAVMRKANGHPRDSKFLEACTPQRRFGMNTFRPGFRGLEDLVRCEKTVEPSRPTGPTFERCASVAWRSVSTKNSHR